MTKPSREARSTRSSKSTRHRSSQSKGTSSMSRQMCCVSGTPDNAHGARHETGSVSHMSQYAEEAHPSAHPSSFSEMEDESYANYYYNQARPSISEDMDQIQQMPTQESYSRKLHGRHARQYKERNSSPRSTSTDYRKHRSSRNIEAMRGMQPISDDSEFASQPSMEEKSLRTASVKLDKIPSDAASLPPLRNPSMTIEKTKSEEKKEAALRAMAKIHIESQDQISFLKEELTAAQEKTARVEEKFEAMFEKMKVISKKHEEYVEQITELKKQLSSAQQEQEKSQDLLEGLDLMSKKNERYKDQVAALKNDLAEAQEKAKVSYEEVAALRKDYEQLSAEAKATQDEKKTEMAAMQTQMETMKHDQEECQQKVFTLLGEVTYTHSKAKREEEKLTKMQGKMQSMATVHQQDKIVLKEHKETIRNLKYQLDTIHGKYSAELEELRSCTNEEMKKINQHFQSFRAKVTILGFALFVCLPMPSWFGGIPFIPDILWCPAVFACANLLFAWLFATHHAKTHKNQASLRKEMPQPSSLVPQIARAHSDIESVSDSGSERSRSAARSQASSSVGSVEVICTENSSQNEPVKHSRSDGQAMWGLPAAFGIHTE